MNSKNPMDSATQITVIEGRSSTFDNWEVVTEGRFEGPDQAREAHDALESLLSLGGDWTTDTLRVRTRLV